LTERETPGRGEVCLFVDNFAQETGKRTEKILEGQLQGK
jgi:hypothetical protein